MIQGKKVVVVMPAYKANKTLKKTYDDLDLNFVDEIILVDDYSQDNTEQIARELGINTFVHRKNLGYGANQKSCYREALKLDADIVIMVHPDYQYNPKLVLAMASMISSGIYDAVLGSRILGNTALSGGMPLYKYIANRGLTFFQNILMGAKVSEYHTGFRAFSRDILESLPLEANTDDFAFDNEMLAQIIAFNYKIGEISCPTKYFDEASSINLFRSIKYGIEVVIISCKFFLWKLGILEPKIFQDNEIFKLNTERRIAIKRY